MTFVLVSLLLGLVVGIVSSLFGIGGGIFIVPLLPNLLGVTAHQAVATSLASVFMVTLLNTIGFSREKLVHWKTGLMLGVPSGIMAFFAGPWAASMAEFYLRAFFLAILILLLVITFLRRHQSVADQGPLVISSFKKSFSIILAVIAGFISSFTGIGAGVILSPIMFNLKMVRAKELVPTTNLSTMLTTFSGTMGYLLVDLKQEGELIHKPIALSLFVVATITGYFVRPHQGKISQPTKIVILCCILLFIILKQAFELYRYKQ